MYILIATIAKIDITGAESYLRTHLEDKILCKIDKPARYYHPSINQQSDKCLLCFETKVLIEDFDFQKDIFDDLQSFEIP